MCIWFVTILEPRKDWALRLLLLGVTGDNDRELKDDVEAEEVDSRRGSVCLSEG